MDIREAILSKLSKAAEVEDDNEIKESKDRSIRESLLMELSPKTVASYIGKASKNLAQLEHDRDKIRKTRSTVADDRSRAWDVAKISDIRNKDPKTSERIQKDHDNFRQASLEMSSNLDKADDRLRNKTYKRSEGLWRAGKKFDGDSYRVKTMSPDAKAKSWTGEVKDHHIKYAKSEDEAKKIAANRAADEAKKNKPKSQKGRFSAGHPSKYHSVITKKIRSLQP